MRQAGIIAAGGLFALQHQVARLQEDHENAAYLAQGLSKLEPLQGKVESHTNMVFVQVGEAGHVLPEFLSLKGIAIWCGETIRMVTHLNVTRKDMDSVIEAFKEFYFSDARHGRNSKTSIY